MQYHRTSFPNTDIYVDHDSVKNAPDLDGILEGPFCTRISGPSLSRLSREATCQRPFHLIILLQSTTRDYSMSYFRFCMLLTQPCLKCLFVEL